MNQFYSRQAVDRSLSTVSGFVKNAHHCEIAGICSFCNDIIVCIVDNRECLNSFESPTENS